MVIVKLILLGVILIISVLIGMSISKKFSTRVNELKEFQQALHIFEEKIKFTYEPIPEVFNEIATKSCSKVAKVFEESAENMKIMSAGVAWEEALDNSNLNLTKDDINTLKGLGKMLGITDLEGQVSEIKLTEKFIDTKIKEAEYERNKNEKLFKTLGVTAGLTLAIILV